MDLSDPLTERQKEIVTLIASGLTSREIGIKLGIAFKTATVHRHNAMRRLKVRNVVALTEAAIRMGLIPPDGKGRGSSKVARMATTPLTAREEQVVTLIVSGLSSVRIGRKLKISFKTAVAHRYQAMRKLNVHNTLALRSAAIRMGLIYRD